MAHDSKAVIGDTVRLAGEISAREIPGAIFNRVAMIISSFPCAPDDPPACEGSQSSGKVPEASE